MNTDLSANTQAILLLTAPLLTGKGTESAKTLTQSEYRRFARRLHDVQCSPADLLGDSAPNILRRLGLDSEIERFERLLARGFLLSQAVERWRTRAIWVVSRADSDYPSRLKQRLRDDAPSVLYGCGDLACVNTGGMAVVGSRNVDEYLLEYTAEIGHMVARAGLNVVSGGARGVDRAAMKGALDVGGVAVGVLADSLEKTSMSRDNRDFLMQGKLLLLSPYDPSAGFSVGHAMQRNKLIYALSDAALVVNSDLNRGGTWAGAIEQLEKRRQIPLYVRSTGDGGAALSALRKKGALLWPNPGTPDQLIDVLNADQRPSGELLQMGLFEDVTEDTSSEAASEASKHCAASPTAPELLMADELFSKVRELLCCLEGPKTETEIAEQLGVSQPQARKWLHRLVEEGVLQKIGRPVRYKQRSQK